MNYVTVVDDIIDIRLVGVIVAAIDLVGIISIQYGLNLIAVRCLIIEVL